MPSESLVLLASLTGLVLIFLSLNYLIYKMLQNHYQSLIQMERERQNQIQKTLLTQLETLLNRLNSKTWQDYVQIQSQMSSPSISEEEPVGGMSDAEELERWKAYTTHAEGVGEITEEVLVDFSDDLEELGLRSEQI